MIKQFFKMVLTIIGVDSGIVQRLTPVIADILDKIIQRVLAGILGKITGEKASPTPTSNAHDIIHLLITEFETKPHFREYVYTNTQRIFDIISLAINKIFTPKSATILGGFTILIICCFWTLGFFLPLSTIII
jgi:hypothetical protein